MAEIRFRYRGLNDGRYEFWSVEMCAEEAMKPVVEWCREQFGSPGQYYADLDYRWSSDNFDMVYIRGQADAAVFRMRWC